MRVSLVCLTAAVALLGCEIEERERPPPPKTSGIGAVGPGPGSGGSSGAGGDGGAGGASGTTTTTTATTTTGGFDPVAELSPFCGCIDEINTNPCSACVATAEGVGCQAAFLDCNNDSDCNSILSQMNGCAVVDSACLSSSTMFASAASVSIVRNYLGCVCQTECMQDCSQSVCQ